MQHKLQRPAGAETKRAEAHTDAAQGRPNRTLPAHAWASTRQGTVYYRDDLQILVKWDSGGSDSLRGEFADRFRILEVEDERNP